MESGARAIVDRGAGLRLLAALSALVVLAGLMTRGVDGATGDPVLLNEALVSHTGTDTTEYVELFGVPGTPLGGLSLVSVEGDSATVPGTIDRRIDFPADAHLGGNGFYLVGNPVGLATTYHVTPDLAWGNDSLENGSQTLALVRSPGLGATGTVVTGGEDVLDAVGLADSGASDQWFWSAPVVGPDDGFLPGGARRLADGVDTDTAADWVFADDLLGPANTPTPATPYVPPTPTPTPTPTPSPTPTPTPTPSPVKLPPPSLSTQALWTLANQLPTAGGKAALVTQRLERVDRFMASGQAASALAQLQALEHQVMGFSPRWISDSAAQALVAQADALRSGLAP